MNMYFIDKKVSVRRAITIFTMNSFLVDDDEVMVIVDFFYLMPKYYTKEKVEKTSKPKGDIKLYKK